MSIKVLRNLGVFYLPHPGMVVVNCMSREDKEVVATVEGKLCVPSPEVQEAVLPPTLVLWE